MAYLSLEKETCFFSDGVFPLPSPGKLKFSRCVCFVIDAWQLDLQSSCRMASCLVRESGIRTFEMGMCKHCLSDLGFLCGQAF